MRQLRFVENLKKGRYAASFLRGKLVHTNLQILYECNFRCRICDFWKAPYTSYPRLSLENVRTISRQLNRIGPQIVSIGGGEPLLHPDIVGIVEVLARHHFPVMICNGWYVTPEIARALFQAGMYEISVSIDYADPARHDEQRGAAGAFDRAIRALEVLHCSRVHPDQRVHMISVIMNDNLDHVEPLIKRCREMGITYLVTLYSDCRGKGALEAAPSDVSRRLLALKKDYPEFVALRGYVGSFSRAVSESGIGPCYTGKHLCNIDSQGQVSLCIDRVEAPVANILTDDIRDIERRLLERHRANNCRTCWTSCRGSIETVLYGPEKAANLWDYYQMTKPVGLTSCSTTRWS